MARIPLIIVAGVVALLLFAWVVGARVQSDGKLQDSQDDRIFQGHKHDSTVMWKTDQSRNASLKVRYLSGTTDDDDTTNVDISSIKGIICGFLLMIHSSDGLWEVHDNDKGLSEGSAWGMNYQDANHASPNIIQFESVGVSLQDSTYRLMVFYIPRGEG